jgi:hypothetical protein
MTFENALSIGHTCGAPPELTGQCVHCVICAVAALLHHNGFDDASKASESTYSDQNLSIDRDQARVLAGSAMRASVGGEEY